MIYTLTLNPAIDNYIYLDRPLSEKSINTPKEENIKIGGKGINLSLQLKNFGTDTVALGFVSGRMGECITSFLKNKGIEHFFVNTHKGETRINTKIIGKSEIQINGRGPMVDERDTEELKYKIKTLKAGDIAVVSGSCPKCEGVDILEEIFSSVPKGVKLIADLKGAELKNVLKYKPFLIKPNIEEFKALVGKESLNLEEELKETNKKGAENILLSLGEKGALFYDGENIHREEAIPVNVKNTIGCGDSMLAAFIYAYEKGFGVDYCLSFAVKTGSLKAQKGEFPLLEEVDV
ncbi:MAG: hexose kinase [Firmicutes bacterium]|nr:hexose kinase [Bacillota bacterium]